MELVKTIFAILACILYTNFLNRTKRIEIVRDVRGIAVVRAVCAKRMSLRNVTFYENRVTRSLNRNWMHHSRLGRTIFNQNSFVSTAKLKGVK